MKWKKIEYEGVSPGPRRFHEMIYNQNHNSILLFGGTTSHNIKSNELYEYDILNNHWKLLRNEPLSEVPEPSEACVISILRIIKYY